MAGWVIRGIPRGLARDMWWFSAETEAEARSPGPRAFGGEGAGGRAVALLALVALADGLFFDHAPGLSLALYAAAVLGAAMALTPGRERLGPALLLLASALPVIEHVQALSLGFLALGLGASLVWASGGTAGIGRRLVRLVADLPLRGLLDGTRLARDLGQSGALGQPGRLMRSWAFPLGGALVLTGLLIAANPVLGDLAGRLLRLDPGARALERLVFWTGAALLVWPLIAPLREVPSAATPRAAGRAWGPGASSVARGLVVFNAILAVQTVMDAVYLWGGAALPEGMTAAEYAHRGAYPLLVTALLAGAFALAARPFAAENRWLRGLLMLWLAQNVALTLSALLRLELYVEAFGLTYLRVHAAIWMALVAAGLGLTAWQVWRGLPNGWLVLRSAALGMGVLYACCFVNFAAIIAAENLSRPEFDGTYVCALGPTAAGSIRASGREVRVLDDYGQDLGPCQVQAPLIEGWRDWGFRNWRVRRYLDGLAEGGHEDPRRG